jgi:hypothetical protein
VAATNPSFRYEKLFCKRSYVPDLSQHPTKEKIKESAGTNQPKLDFFG